jgi:hypothetical protein
LSAFLSTPLSLADILAPFASKPLEIIKDMLLNELSDRRAAKRKDWLFFTHELKGPYGQTS